MASFPNSPRRSRRRAPSRQSLLEPLEQRALLALLSTIEGINFDEEAANSGQYHIPLGADGAAGPEHVVSVVNTSIEWHTKSGTQQNSQRLGRDGSTATGGFFAPLDPVNGLFDPEVVYDQYGHRFVVVAMEVNDTSRTSRMLVAVSDDSDPNGTWRYMAINSAVSIENIDSWADDPGLAVGADAVYVTANMVAFGQSAFQGSRLWVIPKSSFYDTGTGSATVYNPSTAAGLPSQAVTLQPAHMYGTAPGETGTFLVSSGWTSGATDYLSVIRVDNPLGLPTFTNTQISLGDIDSDTPFPNAPQLGTSLTIATHDDRILSAVWRDNTLWATNTVNPPSGSDSGQATVHWYQIDTTTLSSLALADQGDVGGEDIAPGTFTFSPSIAVDSLGNMALGFSASAPTIYPGAYYTGRMADDPAGTTRPCGALATGTDWYYRTLGSGENDWGGGSGLSIDPGDDLTFWAFNQYAMARGTTLNGEDGRWATRWGSFTIGDQHGPGDGIATVYALLVSETSEMFSLGPIVDFYNILTVLNGVLPENIEYLIVSDTIPSGYESVIDGIATPASFLDALRTIEARADADDVVVVNIETYGTGYLGYTPLAINNVAFHGFTYVEPLVNQTGDPDEFDYLESEFELSLFVGGGLRTSIPPFWDFHAGLGQWAYYWYPDAGQSAYIQRWMYASHYDDLHVEGVGTISDNDVDIDRFESYARGDVNRDGYVDETAGEILDWDGDGVPPFDRYSGAIDEDDWAPITVHQNDVQVFHSPLPNVPYRIFDAGLDDHVDIDVYPVDGGPWEVDGTDLDNSGTIDGIDLNDDGDQADWVALNEEISLWDGSLTDADVAAAFNAIGAGAKVFINNSCFSGGFIADLSGPNTVVITGSMEITQSASGLLPRLLNEAFDTYSHEADADGNGGVSMMEAFNYAEAHPHLGMGPDMDLFQYDDNGDRIAHDHLLPQGGDGAFGATVFFSPDARPPTVLALAPADDAIEVDLETNLVVTFSEAVQKGAGEIVVRRSSDNTVVESIDINDARVSVSQAVVTIDPATVFSNSTGYYVQIVSGALTDLVGKPFAGIPDATTWNFTTVDLTTPTASIVAVSPDPRVTPVSSIRIEFSEPVVGFDVGDLSLVRDGGANLLTVGHTLTTTDNRIWDLSNISDITTVAGSYVLALVADNADITDLAGNPLQDSASESWVMHSTVAGRHIFYNGSAWDGSAAANADDDKAIATDKSPLLPGGKATLANYTSYSPGINGLMTDIAHLADPAGLSVADFEFRTGNTNTPDLWSLLAIDPALITIAVRPGAGLDGSDRVTVLLPDGAVKKTWLQVTVQATAVTGLAAPDVHYWGNAIGDSGNSSNDTAVNVVDALGVRANPHTLLKPAPIDDAYDYNRDKQVNVQDELIVRANPTTLLTDLNLIDLSGAEGEAGDGRPEAGGDGVENGDWWLVVGVMEEDGSRESAVGSRELGLPPIWSRLSPFSSTSFSLSTSSPLSTFLTASGLRPPVSSLQRKSRVDTEIGEESIVHDLALAELLADWEQL